jgi:hypothetical protein
MSSVIAVWAAAAATVDGIARIREIVADAARRDKAQRAVGGAAIGRAVAVPASQPRQVFTDAVRMASAAESHR